MPHYKSNKDAFNECKRKGFYKPFIETDFEKIRSNLKIVKEELDLISEISKLNVKNENHLYKTYYDILHQLVEVYLMFDKIKSSNHQCLFAYLCKKTS